MHPTVANVSTKTNVHYATGTDRVRTFVLILTARTDAVVTECSALNWPVIAIRVRISMNAQLATADALTLVSTLWERTFVPALKATCLLTTGKLAKVLPPNA